MSGEQGRVVWSSDQGRIAYCPRCGQPEARCQCGPSRRSTRESSAARVDLPRDGVVRLARERKGRGGKVVTLVAGVPGDRAALAALAQDLKRACGAGGTVEGNVIVIQGDHRDRLEAKLRALGFTVKKAGG